MKIGRYFLHGDIIETEHDRVFCAICDFFLPAEHFKDNSHSAERHYSRHRNSRERLKLLRKLGRPWDRPSDARSVFDPDDRLEGRE